MLNIKEIKEIDKKISLILRGKDHFSFHGLSKIGGVGFTLIILVLLYFWPLAYKIQILADLFLSLFLSTLAVFILKYSIKRKRVSADSFFMEKFDPFSFPSGHISRLASFIMPFHQFFYLSCLFILLAILISLVRISKGYHFMTDCLAGFSIGLFSGLIAVLFNANMNGFLYSIFNYLIKN